MARRAMAVELTAEQRAQLERILRASTSEQRLVRRARVALLADEGLTNEEIAPLAGLSPHKAGKWRRRVAEEGIAGLADRPRPGGPRRYGHDERLAVFRTACSPPPESKEDLKAQLLDFIERYNPTAKPFAWTYQGKPLTK